jgi:hypothetical protein
LRERDARAGPPAAGQEALSCLVICTAMNTNASFRSIRGESVRRNGRRAWISRRATGWSTATA